MTNREAKKQMTREQRKEYKAAQRANRDNYYVFVTPKTDAAIRAMGQGHSNYSKIVSRAKAHEMVYGKVDPMTGDIKQKLKHGYVQRETNE